MSFPFYQIAAATTGAMLAGTGVLHLLPRLGEVGRWASAALCRAPALDVVITYFTVAPLIVGPSIAGWRGLGGAVFGQVVSLLLWTALHELAHPQHRRGPRIVKVNSRMVGPVRYMAATWLTAAAAPILWIIRVLQIVLWPAMSWLVGLPRYRAGDWVNVSRHKFSGLIGYDLIWCLYCDWMTSVWALGSEMLRNVESFWCPIRFANDKKCANCALEFPDVERGWVAADGTMAQVATTLERMYGGGQRSWFGHPARLTVKGKPPELRPASGAHAEHQIEAPLAR